MSVGSVAIKENNGSDLHSAQKIPKKWLIEPILGLFEFFGAILSYIKL